MASLGEPSKEALEIWNAIRDARDAAIDLVETRTRRAKPLRGADVDDAARRVIEARGYGQYFTHRTGHSIDPRDLHGSGPHLDNLETREERLLVPGVGVLDRAGDLHPRQDRHADGGERLHHAGRGGRDAAGVSAGVDDRLTAARRATRGTCGASFAFFSRRMPRHFRNCIS